MPLVRMARAENGGEKNPVEEMKVDRTPSTEFPRKTTLPTEAQKASLVKTYGKLPLYFIENRGQVDGAVRFYEKGGGHATFFTTDGVVISLTKTDKKSYEKSSFNKDILGPETKEQEEHTTGVVSLSFVGANKAPRVVADEKQAGRVNYFVGNDKTKWRTNIPTYGAVTYKEVYRNIDVRFYGNNQKLEHDVIVRPGGDVSKVRFVYDGIEGMRITDTGDLEVRLEDGKILEKKPVIYQEIDGRRVAVDGKYRILGDNTYGFDVASYDHGKDLVIDPVLVYSTYLGGKLNDIGFGIFVDSSGAAYVTGESGSIDFPLTNPLQGTSGSYLTGAFITKINTTGTALVYSTFLGGNGWDSGRAITVDSTGAAYVTGFTKSGNFPTINAIQVLHGGGLWDAFITKINPAGSSIIYSTYIGGSGKDMGEDIAIDSQGNAYVTGWTLSTNFPLMNPIQGVYGGGDISGGDIFVTKINSGGTAFVYSTYLGGSNAEFSYGIAVDSTGAAYVTGDTFSTDFPLMNPLQGAYGGYGDAFVTKIDSTGSSLVYSTYLGGNSGDYGDAITVDNLGDAYVAGSTASSNFPLVNTMSMPSGGVGDIFVTKINATGAAMNYSTHFGGTSLDGGYGIAVDPSGNAYVTGETRSTDFPLLNPIQGGHGGSLQDAFITKIGAPILPTPTFNGGNVTATTPNPDGSVTYTVQGTGPLGGTYSVTLPPGTQAAPGQSIVINIVDQAAGKATPKFEIFNAVLPPGVTKTMTMARPRGTADNTMCLMDIAPEGEIKVGKTCKAQPGKGTVNIPGSYGSFDCGPGLPCDLGDGLTRHVSYTPTDVTVSGLRHSRLYLNVAHVPVADAGPDQNIYLGQTAYLDGSASSDLDPGTVLSYAWTLDAAPAGSTAALIGPNTVNPSITPDLAGQYSISLVVSDGTYTSAAASVIINVTENLPPLASATGMPNTGNAPLTVAFDASTSTDPEGGALSYFWYFGDPGSLGSSAAITSHTYNKPGNYTALVTVTDDFGNTAQASVLIRVTEPNLPPTVAPTASVYNGTAPLEVQFTANAADPEGTPLTYAWTFGDGATSTLQDPLHTYTSAGTYVASVTASDGNLSTSASVTISVSSPLACNVTEAEADEGKKGKVEGKVDMKANFTYAGLPAPSDLVEVVFDGITLISEPFAVFNEETDKPGLYEFEDKDLHVKMDFNKGTMKVSRHKMLLDGVDDSNGVDVVISFGNATCTDHMVMEEHDNDNHEKKMSHKE